MQEPSAMSATPSVPPASLRWWGLWTYLCVLIVLAVVVIVLVRGGYALAAAVSACLALSAAAVRVVRRLHLVVRRA
jgi:hypothetical protein